MPNAVLAAQFAALEQLAPGRVIAGLGTGDRLSEEENRAYGIPYPPAAERRAEMVELGRELVRRRAHRLDRRRERPGARRRPAPPAPRSTCGTPSPRSWPSGRPRPSGIEVTWAGPPPAATPPLAERLRALHEAGASWVVFGWPVDVEELVAAARARRAPAQSSGGAGAGS